MDEEALRRHRAELRVHCYRMLGSLDDADDLVQETFLRAWRSRAAYEDRDQVRAWLYRIATNACLDFLAGRARRVLPRDLGPGAPHGDVAWLQPLPDQPEDAAVRRETVELAFLAAIAHLPPRQRAVLLLRDVLGWPAKDTADLLDSTVAAANSALQRARATLGEHLPARRDDWTRPAGDAEEERVLRRYMDAVDRADLAGLATLLAEDVRTDMPPYREWFAGRDAVVAALRFSWDPRSAGYVGRLATVATRANGGPAAAVYADGHPFAIVVPSVVDGMLASATAFHDPGLFRRFGLPMSFPGPARCTGHD